MRSFADPDTHFRIVRSDTPVSVDGYALGEPTGEVSCAECQATAMNVDEIPHRHGCSQRFVHSQWYAENMEADR